MNRGVKHARVARRSPQGPRIGEMLVAEGLITEEQLADALLEQQDGKLRLGSVLIERGVVAAVDLFRVLARHFDLEFVDLDEQPPDPSVVRLVKESFARYHQLLPIGEDGPQLVLAMANPTNVFSLDDARTVTGRSVRAVMAEPTQLARAIDRVWGTAETEEAILRIERDTERDEELEAARLAAAAADDAPVVQFVNQLIARAVTERASDIHFDPAEKQMRVRFRIDGVLHEVMHVPRSAQLSVVSRVKIMAEINIAERRVPQDGRVSLTVGGRPVSLRVVTLPTAHGESVVIRVLEEGSALRNLGELGMRPEALKVFEAGFRRPWGSVLVTGPTGSGKSTTMYAAVAELNDPTRNIVTIEDPVEYRFAGVKQLQVNRKAGLTFPNALRSILRADPDVVMVGEVRDLETAQLAVEAALTGHLVLTSLHTNDASSTPARLLDMGVEAFKLTSSINCIVAQRLARRLCERCKQPYEPVDEAAEGVLPAWWLEEKGNTFFRPVGCNACAQTGYLGRLGIHEAMEMTDELAHLVVTGATARSFQALAVDQGMVTMRDDGLRKAAAGETSIEEVLRAVG